MTKQRLCSRTMRSPQQRHRAALREYPLPPSFKVGRAAAAALVVETRLGSRTHSWLRLGRQPFCHSLLLQPAE